MNKATPINPVNIPTDNDEYICCDDIINAINSGFITNEERDKLQKFLDDIKDYVVDWEYGETLIRETSFTEYVKELAYDVAPAPINSFDEWPWSHIDWDSAANELKNDYAELPFGNATYYGRMG